jgi:hypothetical protein
MGYWVEKELNIVGGMISLVHACLLLLLSSRDGLI